MYKTNSNNTELPIYINIDKDTRPIPLNSNSCLKKVLPNFYSLSQDEYNHLIYIEELYKNINDNKENFLVVKGLFNTQFQKLNYLVIFLSFFISLINLSMAALGETISQDSTRIFEISVGIIGLFIAIITKTRDQKVDLVHKMLTAVDHCNDFLENCEKYILVYVNKDNIPLEEQNKITLASIISKYETITNLCNDVYASFNSLESQAIVNGPIPYLNCCNCHSCEKYTPDWCYLYNGKWIKAMNQRNDNIDKEILVGITGKVQPQKVENYLNHFLEQELKIEDPQ